MTSLQVLFFSYGSISKYMACFYFLSIKASYTEESIVGVACEKRFYV